MKLKVFILTILSLFLFSACKKNKDNNPVQAETLKEKKYKDGYQIVDYSNGCDTKRHDFSSKSASDVKKQLCLALQDHDLNDSCAESLREELFNEKCAGFVWQPKYNSETRVDNDTKVKAFKNELKFSKILNNLISKEIKLVDSLNENDQTFAKKLSEDIQDCGFSYMGTKCLINGTLSSDDYVTRLEENDENLVFLSELGGSDDLNKVSMLFQIEKNEKEFSSSKLALYRRTRNIGDDENIKEYLADKETVVKLMDVTIAKNIFEEARKRSKEAENIRALFHYSRLALKNSRNDDIRLEVRKEFFEKIKTSTDIIVESDRARYQLEILELIRLHKNIDLTILSSICEELLDSDNNEVKQFASVITLWHDPLKVELKQTVIKALKSSSRNHRRGALEALAKTTLQEVSEENAIILIMDDPDWDVRKKAYKISKKFNLSNEHLDTLVKLQSSDRWQVRREASKLLGKILGSKAIVMLVEKMNDKVNLVREEIFKQLKQRIMQLSDVDDLEAIIDALEAKLTTNANESDYGDYVRRNVVLLLEKINVDRTTSILINAMNVDSIRGRIVAKLKDKKRNLTDKHLDELIAQAKNDSHVVRRSAVKLIATFDSYKATIAIIEKLDDNAFYIGSAAFEVLKSRELTSAHVPSLSEKFKSTSVYTRKNTAILLGKIKDKSSLVALNAQLKMETVDFIKELIITSIVQISESKHI